MFNIEYVNDLQWTNPENTMFSCMVKYTEFGEELPTGVDATDPYAHIHEIWVNGIAGEYGPIAEYVPVDPDQPPPVPPTAEQNKETATRFLQETDWTSIADISNPELSNPYLINQAEFLQYRSALREIAVYPPTGFITFPTKPNEVWSS